MSVAVPVFALGFVIGVIVGGAGMLIAIIDPFAPDDPDD